MTIHYPNGEPMPTEDSAPKWRVVEADTTALVALCSTAAEAHAVARTTPGAFIVEPPTDVEGEAA